MAFESTLERDFLIRLEADRSVLEVASQPVTIYYRADGREYPYTPDFLVHYRQFGSRPGRLQPSELVEVKPKDELAHNLGKWRPKFRAATRHCLEKGWVFRLMHEDRIRDQAWENMRFLARYRRIAVDEDLADWVMATARAYDCVSFQHLLDASCFSKWGRYGKAHGIAAIWHLVVTGRLECDLFAPLTNDTVIWVAENER